MRTALEKETNKPLPSASGGSPSADIIDFKKIFAENMAHSRAIDTELKNCELSQSNQVRKITICTTRIN